jgi:alpha-beta hydrolase superfamily lysophospholipase
VAGHGRGRAAFDASGRQDWLASARQAYAWLRLQAPGKKTLLIGHSAGGLLATHLAREHPKEVSGLVLGAPAFRLASATAPLSLIPLVRLLKPSLHFDSPHKDSMHWVLDYSSSCVAELVRAGREAVAAALGLELPVLMIQANGDDLVSARFNKNLFGKIPSSRKQFIAYETGEHNVFHHYNPLQAQAFAWVDAGIQSFIE